MLSSQWKFMVVLCALLLLPSTASLGQAREGSDADGRSSNVGSDPERSGASYEARLRALEQKAAEQDALKAELENKDDEIRALRDQVSALEDGQGAGSLTRRVEQLERAEAPRHTSAPVGAYGGLMNPDISFIADFKGFVSSDGDNPLNQRFLLEEAEIGFQGFLWPGIRADAFVALEQEADADGNIATEVDLEEAYVSFLDVPGGLQVQAGRKFQDFGRLNPIHPHHWAIPETPLPLRRLFGDHNWFDDGAQVSWLVPNPWETYVKIQGGVWSGWQPGHAHGDEHEHEEGLHEFEDQLVRWDGNVFTARASLDFPIAEHTNLMPGYSFAGDDGGDTFLHGLDLTLIHRWPQSYRRLRWQNEFFFRDTRVSPVHHEHAHEHEHEHEHEDEHHFHHLLPETRNADDWGGYSMLQLTLNRYWETGLLFDWWDADNEPDEWGLTAFLSYFFSHSTYLRPAYRYHRFSDGRDEHVGLIQFVWGLGPHAHRLED